MRTDTVIKHEGFHALFDTLWVVETECFIALLKRDNFDCTEWRKGLWENISVEELSEKAMEYISNKQGK
ncbi:MAG: hypothetical protein M0R70_09195 [Nitrospirae bacterium]|nr:hypothetical protein [Nitrospirota bacterium]